MEKSIGAMSSMVPVRLMDNDTGFAELCSIRRQMCATLDQMKTARKQALATNQDVDEQLMGRFKDRCHQLQTSAEHHIMQSLQQDTFDRLEIETKAE